MIRKVFGALCLVLIASMAAVAGNIPFSGPGPSRTVDPGQPFSFDLNGVTFDPVRGIPGVGAALSVSSEPTIDQSMIAFNLPSEIAVDPLNLGTTCNGGPYGGTVSCASPYPQPWNVTTLATTSVTFTALPGGDLVMNGDLYFASASFTSGYPNVASFNGDAVTPVPESSSLVLLGTGILGLAGVFRRKLSL